MQDVDLYKLEQVSKSKRLRVRVSEMLGFEQMSNFELAVLRNIINAEVMSRDRKEAKEVKAHDPNTN